MEVPGFLARQFYVAGSLRNTADGFSLAARNPLGDGTLVGIGRLAVDGREIRAAEVSASRAGQPGRIQAAEVSRWAPIRVRKGDAVTLHIVGEPLAPGEHHLEVELFEVNLGALRFSIADRVADG